MVPLAQLKLSKKRKIISYQKIKNSSKGYYCRVLRQKKNVVKKKLNTSLYNWLFICFYKILRLLLKKSSPDVFGIGTKCLPEFSHCGYCMY